MLYPQEFSHAVLRTDPMASSGETGGFIVICILCSQTYASQLYQKYKRYTFYSKIK